MEHNENSPEEHEEISKFQASDEFFKHTSFESQHIKFLVAGADSSSSVHTLQPSKAEREDQHSRSGQHILQLNSLKAEETEHRGAAAVVKQPPLPGRKRKHRRMASSPHSPGASSRSQQKQQQ